MEDSEGTVDESEAIIVKADEVDEAGADISTISPTDSSESEFTDRIETRRAQDAQSSGNPKVLANAVSSPPRPLSRPVLRRDGSAPAPPQQPPPPAPPHNKDETSNPTDSLSLLQLKRLAAELPKIEPKAYAYDYTETRSFPEEIQEWFQYSEQERHFLLRAKHTFIQTWEQAHSERPESSDEALEWTDVDEEDRTWFLQCAIKALDSNLSASRIKSLECISYLALGAWGDTAGVDGDNLSPVAASDSDSTWSESQKIRSNVQLTWMVRGAHVLFENGAVQKLVKLLNQMWKSEQNADIADLYDVANEGYDIARSKQLELDHILTTLYVLVEIARWQAEKDVDHAWRTTVADVEPNLLLLLTQMVAKLRWEDPSEPTLFSRQRLFLLLWKTLLLVFGSFKELKDSKTALRTDSDMAGDVHDDSFITASPLDYHLFRQEITSKYPAYCPPQPLVPIELENNSILPPLPNHPSRQTSQENMHSLVGSNPPTGSIFNQPVHIATPAPSPPPSPAGPGGKSGKKQNYQTNQNFPFLYPPPGEPRSIIDNKADNVLFRRVQDARWDNSDVPASILEAGSLFASRMRMSRSLQQLWDVREEFIKAERGWNESVAESEATLAQVSPDEEDLDRSYLEDRNGPVKQAVYEGEEQEARPGPDTATRQSVDEATLPKRETENEEVQRRLDCINQFYRNALPDLQSFVIVLFKELFQNVQALIVQNGASVANGAPEDGGNDGPGKRRTNQNSSASLNGMANGHLAEDEDGTAPAVEGLNEMRSTEISSKAVSGILLVLLKWFKVSHIMKFEYLTQLLLDANFLPLVLKFFAHQDVDKAVEQKHDREDLDFFSFCYLNSKHPPSSAAAGTTSPSASVPEPALSSSPSSSEDEAAPPPISKHRRSPTVQSHPPTPPPPATRPEVDELGFPTSGALPQTPLTHYAPRFFLTNINLLRLLQKITKRKAHRALLLVQYKSSTILRKALKIPQPSLRLYTLKLFKSQVPYCGRKWRQTNMRVITAIYLHCRPELRDEWLCGGDVDGVVEEALPLEQAARGLVHWWHLRNFREVMEGESGGGSGGRGRGRVNSSKEGVDREDYDFFARELDKMGWGVGGTMLGMMDEDEGVEGMVNAQVEGRNEFDGGPLQMEGWA